MKRALLFLAAALVACCSSPTEPNRPHAILIQALPDSVLKIGSVVTFTWECVDCQGLRATTAEMYIVAGGGPLRLFSGPLTGSKQWVVGTVDDSRSLPGGVMRPGWYALSMQSGNVELGCGQDCPGVEAISSPTSMAVTLVQ